MNHTKFFLHLSAISAFAFCFAPQALAATETVDGIKWTYMVANRKASVGYTNLAGYVTTAITNTTRGAITIPSSLGGYPVTGITKRAFESCASLTSITIPDSVTSIGYEAFYGCSNLTSMTILGNVTNDWSSMSRSPFYDCKNLSTLVLGGNMTKIGNYMFFACTNLTSVTIGNNVRSIGGSAFSSCSGLTSVTIPDSVTSIGEEAFSRCSGLTSVTIPDSVTSIGGSAFSSCSNITSVVIPASVTSIGNGAFDNCPKLWASWYGALNNLAAGGGQTVSLSVTNVIVHYVTQSVPSEAVIPDTSSPGIVNVLAEVTAPKALAIPSDWADQYPGFEEAFGSDFAAAVVKESGKRDGSGNAMFVWQDFVAGTDPTDPSSVFTASLTFDAETGEPIVSWSPELSPEEAAKRIYTVSGKERMTDEEWTAIDGNAAAFNFFRVTVEMR